MPPTAHFQTDDKWRAALRKALRPKFSKLTKTLEKSFSRFPQTDVHPWMIKAEEAIEKSIERYYNLRDVPRDSAYDLGIVTGHLETCSALEFKVQEVGPNPPISVVKGIRRLKTLMKTPQSGLKTMSRKIHSFIGRQSADVKISFYNGYVKALDRKLHFGIKPAAWETGATRIYVCLVVLAPWMPQIRSVRHLHEILCQLMGSSNLELLSETGQPKTLGQLCWRIGLSFKKPGRPRVLTTSAA